VSPAAAAFALTAALLHASWNAGVKRSSDPLLSLLGIVIIAGAASMLWLPFAVVPSVRQVGLVLVSVALHVGYDVLLTAAYRLTDLSIAYPIARGLAAVLGAMGGVLLLGDRLDTMLSVGVVAAGIGLLAIALQRASLRAVMVATAAAVLLAGFTLIDAVLAREFASSLTVVAYLFPLHAVALAAYAVRARGAATVRTFFAANRGHIAVGGVAGLASYLAVLAALQRGAVGPVLALREASIVFAVLIAVVFLRERPTRATLTGAGILAASSVIIASASLR
jgi:drug/metabolite transporter (DMT)-like permease